MTGIKKRMYDYCQHCRYLLQRAVNMLLGINIMV